MLPVPDGGGSYSELGRDIFLVQTEFETAPAQVVSEGDRFLSELGKWLNLKGNFDFVGLVGCLRKVGKGTRTPVFVVF